MRIHIVFTLIGGLAMTPALLAEQSKKPYQSLFVPGKTAPAAPTGALPFGGPLQPNLATQAQAAPAEDEAGVLKGPTVLCGMLVIPVTDAVDPGMRKMRPADDETRYTIRAVTPPVCRQDK